MIIALVADVVLRSEICLHSLPARTCGPVGVDHPMMIVSKTSLIDWEYMHFVTLVCVRPLCFDNYHKQENLWPK